MELYFQTLRPWFKSYYT